MNTGFDLQVGQAMVAVACGGLLVTGLVAIVALTQTVLLVVMLRQMGVFLELLRRREGK